MSITGEGYYNKEHAMIRLVLILSLFASTACAQFPDGTLVFSAKPGTIIGNVAMGMASNAQGSASRFTHVGIILNNRVYHADYPWVSTRKIGSLKLGERAIYVVPTRAYSVKESNRMLAYAVSQIGKRYRLKGFIRCDGTEGWCSPFVKNVLNAGGYRLTYRDGFTPDNLLKAIR